MFNRNINNRISIVKRGNLSLTYRADAWFNYPQSFNSRIHLCWSIKTGTLKYKDRIKTSFVREKAWLCFCKALKV